MKQLADYLVGKARELAPTKPIEPIKKMIGIGIDGQQVMYLRYAASENRAKFFQPVSLETQLEFFKQPGFKRGGFQIVGPMSIDEASVDWLLYSLQFFHRRALEPRGLAEVFGPETDVACGAINALYHRLLTSKNPRVEMFFAQWDMIFGVVYGQELERGDTAAKELAKLYKIADKPHLKKLLFAIHTYYVLLMKLLAAELISLQEGSWFASFTADIETASDEIVRQKIEHLENGGLFAQFNIVNFLEGDFFRWYLDVWDVDLGRDIRHIAIALQQFEPATATIDPDATRDLLKRLYQYLVPRRVRHDLGEYYTPDWLAERLIRQIGYDGNPDKRVLDPGCGSGTFLALCIRKAFDFADRNLVRPDELVAKLLANITGFDLNPLAVIAARTNFLLSLGTLIRHASRIEIPVYFCDSILTPAEFSQDGELQLGGNDRHVSTSEGEFAFPASVIEKDKVAKICGLIEQSVQLGRIEAQFLEKLRQVVGALDEHSERLLSEVFRRIAKLNADGRNGIWARFLKNQFAPVFVGKNRFDFVIGNPPWVNWQSLSDSYREKTWRLWDAYGLFSLSGHAARLGGGKKDLAMLFTYVCLDNYVKAGSRLGFIITQTLFKTKGAGDGFRRFRLGNGEHFRVQQVDDLSDFQPFEGATNRTAIVTFQKGKPTKYPVRYLYWRKKEKQSIGLDDELDEVHPAKVNVSEWQAQPINPVEPCSPWLTARPKALAALKKVVGQSDYKANAGATSCGADGVFIVEIKKDLGGGRMLVANHIGMSKKEILQVEHALEAELLHPVLRGKDIHKWHCATQYHVCLVQDLDKRKGYDEELMKQKYPEALAYLLKFRNLLSKRMSQVLNLDENPFYSIYGVSRATLSSYKVLWGRVAQEVNACVAAPIQDKFLGKQVPIPFECIMVACSDNEEAHYLCAAINSSPARLAIKSYIVLHPDAHVLQHVRLPKFDASDKRHRRLAALSESAHRLCAGPAEPDARRLKEIETEIDETAAELWNITGAELRDIQFSLGDRG